MSTEVVGIAAGTSTVIGLIGMAAYFYYDTVRTEARKSLQSLLENESRFNADQILKILSQFQDDERRLEALKRLTDYDNDRAKILLYKSKEKVDLVAFAKAEDSKKRLHVAAPLMLCFGILGIAYETINRFSSSPPIGMASGASDVVYGQPSPPPANAQQPPMAQMSTIRVGVATYGVYYGTQQEFGGMAGNATACVREICQGKTECSFWIRAYTPADIPNIPADRIRQQTNLRDGECFISDPNSNRRKTFRVTWSCGDEILEIWRGPPRADVEGSHGSDPFYLSCGLGRRESR